LRHQGGEILQIELKGAKVTDADLETFKGLKYLKTLALDRSLVTDAGLERLKGLSQLEHVSVVKTQVTEAGAVAFKKAVPGCHMTWSEDDLDNAMINLKQRPGRCPPVDRWGCAATGRRDHVHQPG